MHRAIVQPGQIPLETDILWTNRHAMIGIGQLAQAVLGTATAVDGLSLTPTTPTSMSLTMGPGSIFSLQPVDASAYGSLPANTSQFIVKEGISLSPQALTFAAPTTSGYAQSFLVQAEFTEFDGDPILRAYYNLPTPANPLQGPGNSGQSDNTTRKDSIAVTIKSGVAAPVGTQAIPAPDAGYVGLYVVTLTQGQTTIGSSNIAIYSGAPFIPVKLPQIPTAAQDDSWNFAIASGTTNALTASLTPAPAALVQGMRVSILAQFTNSGAATFSLKGLGTQAILARDGTDLIAGDIAAGAIIDLRYNGNNAWQLVSDRSTRLPLTVTDNSLWHIGTSTGGSATALTTILSPLPSQATAGLCMRVPITTTNGVSPTLNFGFGNIPLVYDKNGAALTGGELRGGLGYYADIIFDGTSARVINPIAAPAGANIPTVYSAAGTYTFTPNVSGWYIVIATGAGGGGGFSTSSTAAGGGGGGGGYCVMVVYLMAGTTYPMAVGAGGLGGIASVRLGAVGGTTSFNGIAMASGGSPGVSVNSTAGFGGAPGGGLVAGAQNVNGQNGYQGFNTNCYQGGIGGRSANPASYGAPYTSDQGNPGQGPGSGGSGAVFNSGVGFSGQGGSGSDGQISIQLA